MLYVNNSLQAFITLRKTFLCLWELMKHPQVSLLKTHAAYSALYLRYLYLLCLVMADKSYYKRHLSQKVRNTHAHTHKILNSM